MTTIFASAFYGMYRADPRFAGKNEDQLESHEELYPFLPKIPDQKTT